MMNINEYFESVYSAMNGNNAASDYECFIFDRFENDDEWFENWAVNQGIDLEARRGNDEYTELTYWAWAMCGD